MDDLLPVVKNETGFSVGQIFGQSTDAEFIEREIERLSEINPVIAEVIARWSTATGEANAQVAFMGIMVYRLLESQAEADRMNEEFI